MITTQEWILLCMHFLFLAISLYNAWWAGYWKGRLEGK